MPSARAVADLLSLSLTWRTKRRQLLAFSNQANSLPITRCRRSFQELMAPAALRTAEICMVHQKERRPWMEWAYHTCRSRREDVFSACQDTRNGKQKSLKRLQRKAPLVSSCWKERNSSFSVGVNLRQIHSYERGVIYINKGGGGARFIAALCSFRVNVANPWYLLGLRSNLVWNP